MYLKISHPDKTAIIQKCERLYWYIDEDTGELRIEMDDLSNYLGFDEYHSGSIIEILSDSGRVIERINWKPERKGFIQFIRDLLAL